MKRTENVTITRQTVVNGKVVAAVTHTGKRVVRTRPDGSEFIMFRGRRWELIRGLALVTT